MQAVNQTETAITKPLSFQMTKNLLRISIFQIAYIRNLFPSDYFSERVIFADCNVKVLNPKCNLSKRLVDWVEKGIFEALYKEYLKSLRFGITRDEMGKDLIEEYTFTFAYEDDGEIRMQILNSIKKAPVNSVKTGSVKQLKNQVAKMYRLLVALMSSFDPLPDVKHTFMHLEYYEKRTPKSYEPPYFESTPILPKFEVKPFSMSLGACQTKHMCIGVKARSTAISEEDEEPEKVVESNDSFRVERCEPQAIRDDGFNEPLLDPSEDLSSLDTTFKPGTFTESQPFEVLQNVNSMVHAQEDANRWMRGRARNAPSRNIAPADPHSHNEALPNLQGLSLTSAKAENCGRAYPADGSFEWDYLPPSQPESQQRLKKKKLSRGVLTAAAGPSKRIRMQEA